MVCVATETRMSTKRNGENIVRETTRLDPVGQQGRTPASEPDNDEPAAPPRRFPLFLSTLFTANFAVYLIWGSVLSLLMATQIQEIDPAAKVANLALVSGLGAAVSAVVQPVWGMVSDRLRTRIGKRSPILLLGGLLGGFALILLGLSNTILWISVSWCAVQLFVNMALALQAVIPDRVPRRLRGTTSTIMGLGLMGGTLIGSFYGAAFIASDSLMTGYVILAGLLLLAMVVFVLVNPEASNKEEPREPFHIGQALRDLWISPTRYPDFWWTFAARFMLMLGFFGVNLYLLYIMQDYVGMGAQASSAVPMVSLALLGGSALSIIVCGPWSDRAGRRKPFVAVSSLIVACGVVIPFFIPTFTGMLLFGLVVGLGYGCYQAVDNALITEVLPTSKDAGKDLGIANISAVLPQVMAPALAGVIVTVTGGYQGLFIISSVVAVVGGLLVFPIRKVR